MQYTNQTNIPTVLAVFLATEEYIHHPNTVSVTTLLKPIRQQILSKRLEDSDNITDIESMIASRMGTAIHTAVDKAWDNPNKALKALGFNEAFIKRIVINPTEVNSDQIPIYKEQRAFRQIGDMTITGQYDFVIDGVVEDIKTTSVYTYLNQSKVKDYQLQGSIYRWLNPKIITKDYLNIHYIFTDYSKAESLRNPNYPKSKTLTQKIPLLSLEETEDYIKDRLNQYKTYQDHNEIDIPYCNDKELWRRPTVYKYYKNPNNKRATKVFDSPVEANDMYQADGCIGLVKEVKGQVVACHYCSAKNICSQRDLLILNGELSV